MEITISLEPMESLYWSLSTAIAGTILAAAGVIIL
jgi:hypothetical protein